MIAKKNTLNINKIENSSLQFSLQSCQLRVPDANKDPLAKKSTLRPHLFKYRLRFQLICKRSNVFISLFFKELNLDRLQNRLQKPQLSSLTCLQVQVVSFAVGKEEFSEYQVIDKILFATLFAKN
jgi:hypothetical protein